MNNFEKNLTPGEKSEVYSNPYMPPSRDVQKNINEQAVPPVPKPYHIGSLAVISGLLGILPPLVFWLVYKNNPEYAFVRKNAAATFNFSLCVSVVVILVFWIMLIGPLLSFLVIIWYLVIILLTFGKVREGEDANYLISIPLIK